MQRAGHSTKTTKITAQKNWRMRKMRLPFFGAAALGFDVDVSLRRLARRRRNAALEFLLQIVDWIGDVLIGLGENDIRQAIHSHQRGATGASADGIGGRGGFVDGTAAGGLAGIDRNSRRSRRQSSGVVRARSFCDIRRLRGRRGEGFEGGGGGGRG